MRRTATVLAALLLAAAASPSAASAEWSAPFDLSLPGDSRREAHVAVEPSGAAVAVWLARASGGMDSVQARRIAADGTPGPILDLSPAGRAAATPDVEVDAAGNATVVWSDRGQGGTDEIVRARRITAGGALEATVDLTSAGHSSAIPRVSVAPSGAATIVWFRRPGTVHMRRIDPVGGPGGTVDVSPPDSGSPDVAVAADGEAYIVWATFDGGEQLIHMRRADAGGGLSALVTLSDPDELRLSPQVEVGAAGNPTVAWSTDDGGIELRRASRVGGLGPIVPVAPGDADFGDFDLAVDGPGNATVAWTGPTGASRAVFLRHVSADGTAGPINDLWAGGNDHGPRLAVDGAGIPTLIWGTATTTGASTVRARTVAAAAPFGPTADLWPPSTAESVGNPQVATNAAGEMTAVWARNDGSEEAIVAARFTLPSPPPPPPPPPAPPPPAGDPPAHGTVTQTSCRVPKLKGLRLPKARQRLRRAGCRLGKVTRPRGGARKGRRLVVTRSSRRAGSRHPAGTTVRVTLGWRRSR